MSTTEPSVVASAGTPGSAVAARAADRSPRNRTRRRAVPPPCASPRACAPPPPQSARPAPRTRARRRPNSRNRPVLRVHRVQRLARRRIDRRRRASRAGPRRGGRRARRLRRGVHAKGGAFACGSVECTAAACTVPARGARSEPPATAVTSLVVAGRYGDPARAAGRFAGASACGFSSGTTPAPGFRRRTRRARARAGGTRRTSPPLPARWTPRAPSPRWAWGEPAGRPAAATARRRIPSQP